MCQCAGNVAFVIADVAKFDPEPGIGGGDPQRVLQGFGGPSIVTQHALRLALHRQRQGGGIRIRGHFKGLVTKLDPAGVIVAAIFAGFGKGRGGKGGRSQKQRKSGMAKGHCGACMNALKLAQRFLPWGENQA